MKREISELLNQLPLCMQRDRFFLRRSLLNLQAHSEIQPDAIAKIKEKLEKSMAIAQRRRDNLPVPKYEDALPVLDKREEIKKTINENQVTILCGETGSGKTTQLPKICLELGRGVRGFIGHTQPRRIATRSVAHRLAEELETTIGEGVGYKIRFSDHVGETTFVKVMTDGVLLAELTSDRFLDAYDTIIIDEAHERSLNIDFILGYLKRVLAKRDDLKLIITSATIDPQRFSRHFNDAPIIEVSGRTYPVEIRYRPLDSFEDDTSVYDAIAHAVDELSHEGNGDILVFLPTERDIREAMDVLQKRALPHTEILPLFARLSATEQDRIFRSHTGRRIVLSTNVAETSLTVPGIRYVIDSGVARISRYSYRTKIQRLPIEPISQASAKQRSGRCGRVAAGIAIRLYADSDFNQRSIFTDPEILRTNLASVILQMLSLGIGDISTFPFVDRPDDRQINDGYKLLFELGAVDEQNRLTKLGKQLAKIPTDPSLSRMLIEASRLGCLQEVLIIVSALSIQDPRERPLDAQQKADNAHSRFADEKSDFLSLVKLWNYLQEQMRELSNNKFRQMCKQEFISYLRVREWIDLHQQLEQSVIDLELRFNQEPASFVAIHSALLTGMLSNIGLKSTETTEYLGARQNKFFVFPGSGLFKKQPKWLMAADIVETGRVYARIVAAIEPEWVEKYAAHLLKHHYFEPHWEQRAAQVAGYERVTLYGLTLVAKRRVNYGRVDPVLSREIFIRQALVHGEYETRSAFFQHNWQLIEKLQVVEDKQRRRDMVVDEERLFAFYDERIPAHIHSGPHFEQWLKEDEKQNPKRMFLTEKDILGDNTVLPETGLFPDFIAVNDHRIDLQYHFAPGEPDDGVTALIPIDMVYQYNDHDFDGLVPGLLKEKIVELLKSLPKSLRRNFIPVNEFADACLRVIGNDTTALLPALERHLFKMTGVKIDPQHWDTTYLAPYLKMNFRILGEQSAIVAEGRDLSAIQDKLKGKIQKIVSKTVAPSFARDGLTSWDFDELPERYEVQKDGRTIVYYPGLADKKESVSLNLFTTELEAQTNTDQGLLRLYLIAMASQLKYLRKNLPHIDKLCLRYAPLGGCEDLKNDILYAAAKVAFMEEQKIPRTRGEFDVAMERGRKQLVTAANVVCEKLHVAFEEFAAAKDELKKINGDAYKRSRDDLTRQLDGIVYRGFVVNTPYNWLQQYPRYLKAIRKRVEKIRLDAPKDLNAFRPVIELTNSVNDLLGTAKPGDVSLHRIRWLIEELRVSIVAQELKTVEPVSIKRLQALIDEARKTMRTMK